MFPVQELFCRSAGCGRVRNRAQHRGWAPLHMSYSNTASGSSESRSYDLPLFPPGASSLPLRSSLTPLPLSFSSSSRPSHLPLPASFFVVSTPCRQPRTPSCPRSGARLGAQARHRAAECPPVSLATALGTWTRHMSVGQGSRSSLAELVCLLKQLVVNNE